MARRIESRKILDETRSRTERARETTRPLAYVNRIGGQDELVFDGRSFVVDRNGQLVRTLGGWREAIDVATWSRTADGWACEPAPLEPPGDGLEDTTTPSSLDCGTMSAKMVFPESFSACLVASIRRSAPQ